MYVVTIVIVAASPARVRSGYVTVYLNWMKLKLIRKLQLHIMQTIAVMLDTSLPLNLTSIGVVATHCRL